MKVHPVILQDMRVTANRMCSYCLGHGIYKNDLCYCLTMYYGAPLARATVERLKHELKKFNAEGRHASRRQS